MYDVDTSILHDGEIIVYFIYSTSCVVQILCMSSGKLVYMDDYSSRNKYINFLIFPCRVTPEVLDLIRKRSERATKAKASVKTASRLQRVNYLSTMNNSKTLHEYDQFSSSGMQSAPLQFRNCMTESSTAYMRRGQTLQSILKTGRIFSSSSSMPPPPPQVSASSAVEPKQAMVVQEGHDDEFDEAEEFELQALEQQVGAVRPVSLDINSPDLSEVQQAEANSVDSLLVQLVKEPTDDDELAAKFLLFENFMETVSTIRETTLQFWADNMEQFDGASRTVQQKLINRIDSAENSAIPEDASKWFVYFMTKKANQNSKSISDILFLIKGKLSLLTQDLGECK